MPTKGCAEPGPGLSAFSVVHAPGEEAAMSTIFRRVPALLASGCIIAAVGAGVASARMAGPEVFRATQAMSYVVGSKKAIGYFQSVAGQCQLTLMITEATDPDVGHAPSAARLSVGMVPGQTVSLGSAEGESIVATCGVDGETIEVKRNKLVRS
jgi:hypothetical protein